MSKSIVRLALDGSVACTAPPVRFHRSQESMVPKARSASASTPPSAEQPLELGAPRSRGRARGRCVARTRSRWPASASSSQRAAVRRSCQTMARCRGSPVRRSHDHGRLALVGDADGGDRARRATAISSASVVPATAAQISAASCSTQPGLGEVLGELAVRPARDRAADASTAKERTPVVPASMAITTDIGGARRGRVPIGAALGWRAHARSRCSPAAATARA